MKIGKLTMTLRKALLALSVSLYALCLAFPALTTSENTHPGLSLALFGFLYPAGTAANLSWFANPLVIVCWKLIEMQKFRLAILQGAAALIFALMAANSDQVIVNEGGVPTDLVGLRIGYWFWLGSIIVGVAAALAHLFDETKAA